MRSQHRNFRDLTPNKVFSSIVTISSGVEFQVVLAEQVACYVKIRAKGLFCEVLSPPLPHSTVLNCFPSGPILKECASSSPLIS